MDPFRMTRNSFIHFVDAVKKYNYEVTIWMRFWKDRE
jgi:hypothetical protein